MQQAFKYIDASSLEQLVGLIPLKNRWRNMNYTNRKKITIDKSKVSGNQTLVNFPVLISITDTDLQDASESGDDILITDANFNKLDFEIESWNAGTGTLVAWVRVPQLRPNEDTILYIYWEEPFAVDQQNKAGVWNKDYIAVYHLNESVGGTDSIKDSTLIANHLTDVGLVAFGNSIKIDKGISFNGSTSRLDSKFSTGITGDAVRTVEFWAKANNLGDQIFVCLGTAGNNQLFAPAIVGGKWYLNGFGGGEDWDTGVVADTNLNHHFVTHTPTGMEWYLNGVRLGTGLAHIHGNVDSIIVLGVRIDNFGRLNGDLDEVRVSNIDRTPDFGITSFNNQDNPGTFMSFGPKETL